MPFDRPTMTQRGTAVAERARETAGEIAPNEAAKSADDFALRDLAPIQR
jgi:hypothetical protein